MRARHLATAVVLGLLGTAVVAAPATAADESMSSTVIQYAPDGDAAIVTVTNPQVLERRDATTAATAEASTWAGAFGNAAPALRVTDQTQLDGGRTATRLSQSFAGADVIAGELVVVTDADGALLTVSGGLASDPSPAAWSITALQARAVVAARAASIISTQRVVFDESLIGGDSDVARTAWQVTYRTHAGVTKRAFVDATTSRVMFTETLRHALSRVVCDGANRIDPMESASCTQKNAMRVEGSPELVGSPSTTLDPAQVNEGYDTLLRTSALFERIGVNLTDLIGSDAGDGNGKQLRLIVRYCPEKAVDSCPMSNAFWLDDVEETEYSGGVMFAGDGLATSDDVTAHELTHGITSATSKLIYANEPGAISESISDVFGELVDQSELLATEDPQVEENWYIGEAIHTKDIVGPVRSMSDPTRSYLGAPRAPDRMGSPFWWTKNSDDGGVHINSGVGNKAAYLMGHGGTFRGITVEPIGIHKLAHLYWEVEQRLAPSSRYAVLGAQLRQSCAELIAANVNGYDEHDCAQVDAAVRATQMTAQRASLSVKSGGVRFGNESALRIRLSDAVTTGDPRGRADVPVTIEAMPVTSEEWRPLAAATTDKFGVATVPISPKVSTKYRVTVPSLGPWTGTQAEISVPVRPTLKLTKVKRGRPTVVVGASAPYVQGGHVVLQKRVKGHWVTLTDSGITTKGYFKLSHNKAGPRDRLRVVRHAVGGLARAVINVPR